ncbi:MAG: SDR family oxidoreductase [Betaproteobacteria bacterium]
MNPKHALVFGGSRGIGAAIVRALTRDGFAVAFTYNANAKAAQDLATSVAKAMPGARLVCCPADVREPAAVVEAFAFAERELGGKLQCVVANAGINVPPGPVGQFDPDNFRALVETNIVGAFNVLREAANRVEDGGTIVALTTSMVRLAIPGVGPYTASKAAVESLVRSMAKELAVRKVRVNAVAPGPVDTELFHAGKTDEAKQRSAAISPFNRIGTPDEVAEAVAFVVSPRASWVHGQIVQPNGGMV